MPKSKKKNTRSTNLVLHSKFHKVYLGVTGVLLVAVFGSVIALKLTAAATSSKTYNVANGSYKICLKWRADSPNWKAQMEAVSGSSTVRIQQGATNNQRSGNACGGSVRVNNRVIKATYRTTNASGLNGQCYLNGSGTDKCN